MCISSLRAKKVIKSRTVESEFGAQAERPPCRLASCVSRLARRKAPDARRKLTLRSPRTPRGVRALRSLRSLRGFLPRDSAQRRSFVQELEPLSAGFGNMRAFRPILRDANLGGLPVSSKPGGTPADSDPPEDTRRRRNSTGRKACPPNAMRDTVRRRRSPQSDTPHASPCRPKLNATGRRLPGRTSEWCIRPSSPATPAKPHSRVRRA